MNTAVAPNTSSRSERQQAQIDQAGRLFPSGTIGTPVPQEYRFVASRALGARIYDTDGREWVDHLMGSGPLILGHAHPAVVEAISSQASMSTSHYVLTEPAIELAAEILSTVPADQQLLFTSSGSEAVFYCLRLARAYTGRSRIVKFRGAYHGHNDYAMVEAFARSNASAVASSAGIPSETLDTVSVAEFNDPDEIRQLFAEKGAEIAAVIVEPYQRILEPSPEFLPLLRELTRINGSLLISDEVVTGFRFHYGTAQTIYGIEADMTVFGKIVGGGLPLTAFTGPRDVMRLAAKKATTADDGVYISGTLNGNAISSAAGLATLRELKAPGTYEKLNEIGADMRRRLEQVFERRGIQGTIVGRGPMWHTVFGVDREPTTAADIGRSDLDKTKRFGLAMLGNGVLISPGIRAFLSIAHNEADLQEAVEAADRALASIES